MGWPAEKPPRDFIPPDQIVTLAADLPISEALQILSQISVAATGKSIEDPERRSDPIGVDVQHQHWRDALELLLARNQLWYIEGAENFLIFRPKLGKDGKPLFIPPGLEDPTRVTAYTREVKIEAVFFEGDCKTLREIGINWSALVDGKIAVSGEGTGGNEVVNSIFSMSVAGSGTRGKTVIEAEALMRSMESFEKGRIIARPAVTVADHKVGRIQVGQDFSIKSRDYAGNTIEEFYSAGTILEVTPTILFDGDYPYVHLKIHAERSTVTPAPISTTVNKTVTETEALLYDSEQTAIGGLYVTKTNSTRKGIPVLKDLPWWFLGLRYVFGYNREEMETDELVILIRAHLMDEVSKRFSHKEELDEKQQDSFKRLQERYK